jgi:hypothetical protein
MTKPVRKRVPVNIALAVALRQLGFEMHEVELDHDPALGLRNINADGTDWDPPQHDARYLVWRPKAEHRVKTSGTKATTAGSDVQVIAKGKRLARDTEEFRRRILAKDAGELEKSKSRMRSGPMPGTRASGLKRGFNGRVTRREV